MKNTKDIKDMIMGMMADTLPPWVAGYDLSTVMPCRMLTEKDSVTMGRYSGAYNALLGYLTAHKLGGGNLFGTFKQWLAASRAVGHTGLVMPKGTKATNCFLRPCFLRPVADTPENRKKYPRAKALANGKLDPQTIVGWLDFKVFHESVIDADLVALIKEKAIDKKDENHFDPNEVEAFVASLGLNIEQGRPSYCPATDTIEMPDKHTYGRLSRYYESLIHEIGHWTGHSSRLNRDNKALSNRLHQYSYEELVAEWFCCLKMDELGMVRGKRDLENQAAYLKGWKERNPDPESILNAFFEAQTALRFVNKITKGVEVEETEEVAEAS